MTSTPKSPAPKSARLIDAEKVIAFVTDTLDRFGVQQSTKHKILAVFWEEVERHEGFKESPQ